METGRIKVKFLFGWWLLTFALIWISLAALGAYKQHQQGGRLNWLIWTAGSLVVIGASGFFASALVAIGIFKPSASFEWPAGYAHHVVSTSDGRYVVALEPSGRIQLYDSAWHFLRGWQVNAEGGNFTVVADSNLLKIFTQRGRFQYIYTDTGELVSSSSYAEKYADIPSGRSMIVPTSPLLWPFSSPFGCWGLMVFGGLGMAVARKSRATPAPE